MRIAVCFLYVALNILYLTPVTYTWYLVANEQNNARIWGGINIITQIGFVGYLASELEKCVKDNERLMLQYIKWLSIIDCVYIVACMFMDRYLVYHNTGVFAYIASLGLAVFLVHCALKK